MKSGYVDPFSEVSNIGAGNLATALADFLKKHTSDDPVSLDVLFAKCEEFDKIRDIISAEEEIVITYTEVYDEGFSGLFMLLFPFKSALMLSGIIARDLHIDYLTPKDEDELLELSQISTSAYLSTVNTFLSSNIKHHPMKIVISKAASVEHFIREVAGIQPKDVLLFQVNFRTAKTFYEGDLKGMLVLREYEGMLAKINALR